MPEGKTAGSSITCPVLLSRPIAQPSEIHTFVQPAAARPVETRPSPVSRKSVSLILLVKPYLGPKIQQYQRDIVARLVDTKVQRDFVYQLDQPIGGTRSPLSSATAPPAKKIRWESLRSVDSIISQRERGSPEG